MKNLLSNLTNWRERLKHEPLAIFLDYDGTLSAIAPTPEDARLPYATQEVLKALIKLEDIKVGIISGRGLNDLKQLVPVKGLAYVGSHGIESQSDGLLLKYVSKQHVQYLHKLKTRLEDALSDLPGVLLESKPFSLAIHYRQSTPTVEKEVKLRVRHVCGDAIWMRKIILMSGKKVVEIMPHADMDKGQAVEQLLKRWSIAKYLPIYIGDDVTDESAFKVLRGHGLTVKVDVANKRSKAEYFLNDVEDVRMLLEFILYLRSF